MQQAVLATPCETLPVIDKTVCTGLPDPQSTLDLAPRPVRPRPVVGARLRVVLDRRARPLGPDRQGVARPRRRPPTRRGARQRDGRQRDGDPDRADEAPRVRALGLPGRIRGRVPRLRDRTVQHRDLRPRGVDPRHLDGRDRRPRVDPRRRARRRLPARAARDLRRHLDRPLPDQRLRAPRVHPLPARRPGRDPAPHRRPRDRGHRADPDRAGSATAPPEPDTVPFDPEELVEEVVS